jgi:hypothetical protein
VIDQQFEIKDSAIAGKGVFALTAFSLSERVAELTGSEIDADKLEELVQAGTVAWDDPLQVGPTRFIILDDFSRAINHSCDPNLGVRGSGELFALREIKSGEEITYDYATVVGKESAVWHMVCRCGAKICRKLIGNWESLPKERLEFYRERGALTDHVMGEVLEHKT